MGRLTPTVLGLLAVNVVLAFLALGLPALQPAMTYRLALWYPANPHFGVWQFATSMFMHGSFSHILFNMVALVSFGVLLEGLWGTRRFLEFYLICGLGAALVHTGVNWIEFSNIQRQLEAAGLGATSIQTMLETGRTSFALSQESLQLLRNLYNLYAAPMVGASGAIYGVLVAFGFTYPNARLMLMFVPVPLAAKYVIPGLVALDLLSGLTGFSLFGGGNVAYFAHVGGALIGFSMMWFWRRRLRLQPVAARFEPEV